MSALLVVQFIKRLNLNPLLDSCGGSSSSSVYWHTTLRNTQTTHGARSMYSYYFSATIIFCVCNQSKSTDITSLHLNGQYVHSREYLRTPGNVHNYLVLH